MLSADSEPLYSAGDLATAYNPDRGFRGSTNIDVYEMSRMSAEKMQQSTGMGLSSIHTRIRALNGLMDLHSEPGKGTSVYLEFDIISMLQPQSIVHAD